MTNDDLRDSFGDALTDALNMRSQPVTTAETELAAAGQRHTLRVRTRRRVLGATVATVLAIAGIGAIAASTRGTTHLQVATPPSSTTRPTIPNPSTFQPLTTGLADWTWVSDDHGWALVRNPCGTNVCVALRETTDGGRTWTSLPAPDARIGTSGECATRPCLSNVRFATPKIGWLWGTDLFQTTDGGHAWTHKPSATVVDVEAANGLAMRVTTTDRDCGAGCSYHVDRIRFGTTAWKRVPIGPVYMFPRLLLQGSDTYLVDTPNWAGAGESFLRRSSDGGATWADIDDPCAGPRDGYRTASASAAPGGVLAVLCVSVDESSASVQVSTDRGKTFGPGRAVPQVPLNTFGPIAAASAGTIAIAYSDGQKYGVVVTHDGGATWKPTLTPSAEPTRATAFFPSLGWEDAHTARASFNTDTIWTTRDDGRSWTPNRVTP